MNTRAKDVAEFYSPTIPENNTKNSSFAFKDTYPLSSKLDVSVFHNRNKCQDESERVIFKAFVLHLRQNPTIFSIRGKNMDGPLPKRLGRVKKKDIFIFPK